MSKKFGIRQPKALLKFSIKSLLVASIILPGPMFAQSGNVLEEIIVTATRRETTLQETAMSITSFTGVELERQGSLTLVDYAAKAPNLGLNFSGSFGRFNSGSAAIRGIRSTVTTGGATGFYIDEVPVPEYLNPHIVDVDRIEVLRGPQGTLFGARSMGGTIRVITKQPDTEEINGYLHTSVADIKEGGMEWGVDGGVNVPIIKDVLGARAQLYYTDKSGIYDVEHIGSTSPRPAFTSVSNIDDTSIYGGQLALALHATDNITIRPRLMYQRTDGDGASYADFEPGNFSQSRHNFTDESGSAEHWLANVTVNIRTPWGEIISTTAKYDREISEREDMGEAVNALVFQAPPPFGLGIPGPELPSKVLMHIDDESFIHETRFVSDFEGLGLGRVSLIMGIFYEDRDRLFSWPVENTANSAPGINAAFTNTLNAFLPPFLQIPVPPGAFGTDIVFAGTRGPYTFEEIAVYGELTIRLTDNLRITAGARWSDTETGFAHIEQGFVAGSPVPLVTNNLPNQDDIVVNPKVLMELDINDDLMIYTSASKGFRFGGVNGAVPEVFCAAEMAALGLTPADLGAYDSDSIWNYELGAKSIWFNNRLVVNAAVFHIDWNDALQEAILGSCGFTYTANAGSAESRGFEVEVKATPIDGLIFSMGLGLTDAEIKESTPTVGTSAGDRITQVPKSTFNATAEYTWAVFGNWEAYIRGDFVHHSNSISVNNASPMEPTRIKKGFETLDLRVGAFQANNWDVSLFVRNATNEHINYSDVRAIAVERPGRPRILTNRPRSIGLELRKFF